MTSKLNYERPTLDARDRLCETIEGTRLFISGIPVGKGGD